MSRPAEEAAPEPSPHKVFVGGLSHNISKDEFLRAFNRYNPVDVEIILDKFTQRPRGFGFVWFKDERGKSDAIHDMNNQEIDGRRISVKDAIPQNEIPPSMRSRYGPRGRGGYGAPPPRRDYGRDYPRSSYDRYDSRAGYESRSSYDRGYGGSYDPRYSASYDRGYDSSYRSSYGSSYDREPYRGSSDAYGYRDSYAARGSTDPYASSGYGSAGYDRYDDRGAGGPERRGYSASARSAPYDRRSPPRR